MGKEMDGEKRTDESEEERWLLNEEKDTRIKKISQKSEKNRWFYRYSHVNLEQK